MILYCIVVSENVNVPTCRYFCCYGVECSRKIHRTAGKFGFTWSTTVKMVCVWVSVCVCLGVVALRKWMTKLFSCMSLSFCYFICAVYALAPWTRENLPQHIDRCKCCQPISVVTIASLSYRASTL